MATQTPTLQVDDLPRLFAQLVDIESVSRNEQTITDALQAALAGYPHLETLRDGNVLVARTQLGRAERVIIAGHTDTVPIDGNFPSSLEERTQGPVLVGRGTADMKGGIAVMAHLAAALENPSRDITWVFYDCEEIEASANGMGKLAQRHPDWLADAVLAILMEPTSARIEGGCQGTIRVDITTTGVAAHSARSWLGHNAIHDVIPVLERIRDFDAREIEVEGLTYREGLNATLIKGGLASNVIPDRCTVQVNYRYAPNKSTEQALAILTDLFDGYQLDVVDVSPAARPGLDRRAAASFVASVRQQPRPKYGWTDVARFSELGIPALNYGPADAGKAHAVDEFCPLSELDTCADALTRWLTQEV